jgi:dystonin
LKFQHIFRWLIFEILYFNSAVTEADFRSPRAKSLWDKWRNVWMMAWDRQKRLHDWLMQLRERQRISSFDWDDWRKRVSR